MAFEFDPYRREQTGKASRLRAVAAVQRRVFARQYDVAEMSRRIDVTGLCGSHETQILLDHALSCASPLAYIALYAPDEAQVRRRLHKNCKIKKRRK